MKILAFSDFHYCGSPSGWEALFDKRVIGFFNHHYFRKHYHDQRYLDIAINYILQNPPDLVICTGDITTSSEISEFEYVCDKLTPLVDNDKFDFIFIPGNHDNYVKDPKCQLAMRKAFNYLNRGRFVFDDLPIRYETDEIDFAIVNECYPVNLFFSWGRITKDVENFLLNWLKESGSKPKVLIGHYPLYEGNPVLRFRHKLYGEKRILNALRVRKLDLSICGHVHKPISNIDERGRGEFIVGSLTRNGVIAQIEYNSKDDIFSYNRINLKLTD